MLCQWARSSQKFLRVVSSKIRELFTQRQSVTSRKTEIRTIQLHPRMNEPVDIFVLVKCQSLV